MVGTSCLKVACLQRSGVNRARLEECTKAAAQPDPDEASCSSTEARAAQTNLDLVTQDVGSFAQLVAGQPRNPVTLKPHPTKSNPKPSTGWLRLFAFHLIVVALDELPPRDVHLQSTFSNAELKNSVRKRKGRNPPTPTPPQHDKALLGYRDLLLALAKAQELTLG